MISANGCEKHSGWLSKVEKARKSEARVLIITDYHRLLEDFPLADKLVKDWFEITIGVSKHYCQGACDYFYWTKWHYDPFKSKWLGAIPLKVPQKLIPIKCHKIYLRFGKFVLVPSSHWGIPKGFKSTMKTMFYWSLFVILGINYANQSSRPSIK